MSGIFSVKFFFLKSLLGIMKIQLNGKEQQIETATTLLKLIENEGMAGKRLAAEVNREIITKSEHANYILKDGDNVEIVHAIGGG